MSEFDCKTLSYDNTLLKNIQVDILKEFIAICSKYNLQYFLLGGSCLGAVRHKGYIPWDDDIDVGMPRDDYESFIKVAKTELPSNLFLQTNDTDPEYLYNFAKLRNSDTTFIEKRLKDFKINHGVYIDVFPLDGYEESFFADGLYNIYNFRIKCEFYADEKKTKFKTRILKKVSKILFRNYKALQKKNNDYMKRLNYKDCEIIHNFCGAWGKKEAMPRSYFGKGIQASFEGMSVIIPEQYDLYLTKMYGDYMKLPPENQRVPHHNTELIDLRTSYKNFI